MQVRPWVRERACVIMFMRIRMCMPGRLHACMHVSACVYACMRAQRVHMGGGTFGVYAVSVRSGRRRSLESRDLDPRRATPD